MKEKDILKIFKETKAIVKGHFVYTSGRHGFLYFNKDAIYPYTEKISALCRVIAKYFYLKGIDIDVIAGPAIGGVVLSQWVAHHYNSFASSDVKAVFAEEEKIRIAGVKEKKLQLHTGRLVFSRGYDKLIPGKKVLVVEDILTTGGSAKKVVETVRALDGEVVGLGVLCNRGNVKAEDVGGVPEIFSLINIPMESWEENNCPLCAENLPINTEVGKGREYLLKNRIKNKIKNK